MNISYYNQNSTAFFDNTINVDLSKLYQEFLPRLAPLAHILDAGCGSGRDSKYFYDKNYKVTAFDASTELVSKASKHSGLPVINATFDTFKADYKFDAIWACASLLHVPSDELSKIFSKLGNFLKSGGVFYCSFKYGDNDIDIGERAFTNADEDRLTYFVEGSGLKVDKVWITEDARPDRQNEKWLNAILIKE
jgi:SAM-dependent methyltransferase